MGVWLWTPVIGKYPGHRFIPFNRRGSNGEGLQLHGMLRHTFGSFCVEFIQTDFVGV